MESIMDILQGAIDRHASDLFLIAGLPLTYKVGGRQQRVEQARLMPEDTARRVQEIYTLCGRDGSNTLETRADDDF